MEPKLERAPPAITNGRCKNHGGMSTIGKMDMSNSNRTKESILKNNQGLSSEHGGTRNGAGRKKGIPNKKTQELQEKVASEGITPLDFMLDIMRNEDEDPFRRYQAARDSAPFIHPKLAAQALQVGPIDCVEDIIESLRKKGG